MPPPTHGSRAAPRRLAPGYRLYAVGDVHGRLDLVEALLEGIRADSDARGATQVIVAFLGDLIDRGPASAGVVARLMQGLGWARLVCLRGNHEAAMIDALGGDPGATEMWLRHGGLEALASWGVDRELLRHGDPGAIIAAAHVAIPASHLDWLRGLPVSVRIGDYLLVHAGIRPGTPLDRQKLHDRLWIRRAFLHSRADHGALVIHGHTVTARIDERPNRIGIDTGAYRSGRLSAVGVEGAARWFLDTATR